MFTGLIQEKGYCSLPPPRLFIRCRMAASLSEGDSVAVNGVCLTVTKRNNQGFSADVMPETLQRTTLADIRSGHTVNLERALSANAQLDGHMVSGHVDETGTIRGIKKEKNAIVYTISCSQQFTRFLAEKGSVAIDGISLTVTAVTSCTFSVSTIALTRAETTLGDKKTGDRVNLEGDILAKYITTALEKNIPERGQQSSFQRTLFENGFLGDMNE